MGKGSNRRPAQVSQAEIDRRWSDTFGVCVVGKQESTGRDRGRSGCRGKVYRDALKDGDQ